MWLNIRVQMAHAALMHAPVLRLPQHRRNLLKGAVACFENVLDVLVGTVGVRVGISSVDGYGVGLITVRVRAAVTVHCVTDILVAGVDVS